jgi:gliding motility-associated protein GldE
LETAYILINLPAQHHGILLLLQSTHALDAGFYLPVLVIFLFLFLSGMFSASEVAFFSIKDKLLQDIRESDHKSDKLVARLLQSPKELLSTILISNTIINVAIVILFTLTLHRYFYLTGFIALLFEVILLSIALVIFSELTPKIYASQSKQQLAKFMAYPLAILMKLFKPLSGIMVLSTSLIEKRLKKYRQTISAEDMKHAIDLTTDHTRNIEEKKILNRIVNFSNVYVKQIMTARTDVTTFEKDLLFHELLKEVNANKFSRVPVYQNHSDNIIGILYIKDLLPHINRDNDFGWQELLRKPYFIPETKMIDDLLREFQIRKVHMAVVVDEYGGFSGIITLEDILEEIVGEITDEFDETAATFNKTDENTFLFDAKLQLTELIKILNLSDDYFEEIKGEAETLGGLIMEITGKIPSKNDSITEGNLVFTVEEADNKRIKKVRVVLTNGNDVNQ